MMTHFSHEDVIKSIEESILVLAEKVEELKGKYSHWDEESWPQIGDVVWCVNAIGKVDYLQFSQKSTFLTALYEQGLLFRTRAEAESELHARKIIAKLRRQPGVNNFTKYKENWSLYISASGDICARLWLAECAANPVYFDSMDNALNAVAVVGKEDILKAWKWIARIEG